MFKETKIKAFAFTVVVMAQTLFASPVLADWRAFTCFLPDGSTVPVSTDTSLNNVAVARYSDAQGRTIVVNPNAMAVFQPATQMFWLAHECAHQQLGHTLGNYTAERENQADCKGIRNLVEDKEIKIDGLKAIESDVSKISGDGGYYLSGKARAEHIFNCAITRE